ncbi:MAG: trans-4-hydroxy-L-proline dehydratase [Desulfatirhabdiaceae bacterium]
MNERIDRLRRASLNAKPSISPERALLVTEFYQSHSGQYSIPVMRAKCFYHLCEHKTIFIGPDELIVGERGPFPKAVPTYPELTCHSVADLKILNSRPKISDRVDPSCIESYRKTVIPYWHNRSLRDRLFEELPKEWHDAYAAGIFTEFMEQRAPGHTVLDDKIYRKGMLDFKADIAAAIANLDFTSDSTAFERREALKSMNIACDAVIRFAERHAELAENMAQIESPDTRKAELLKIADACRHVPANPPRTFHEALQYYWFCHLAVITELNGWDAFNPGHLDQHLLPFYQKGLADNTLTPESARELLEAFFIKFNNHPSPPKVGVTAAESGTYTDFANINIAGLLPDGSDGSNDISHMLLEIVEDMHLLQPSTNVQVSRKTPDDVLKHALRVIRRGYGFPSLFNADSVVEEQIRQGKTLEDARAGGCSGCVEVGAFGKEAYILTGYFNLPKILELTLHDGMDPRTGKKLSIETGAAEPVESFDALFDAFRIQLNHFIDIKIQGNQVIEQIYAASMPAPFLSVLIDDCIQKGKDYNAGGARYNNTFIQAVGIGSLTDCFSGIRHLVFEKNDVSLDDLVRILDTNFEGQEALRQKMLNKVPRYGNDLDEADDIMVKIFQAAFNAIDGRPNSKGGHYRLEMLPTTSHVYFGSVIGAMPDGRIAGAPLSEGISPVQGADRNGPTAVIKSAGKMDQVKTGGALLNLKFTPALLAGEDGITHLSHLVRSYFKLDGHHLQFNVVSADLLKKAKAHPDQYRDLIVRVAGYSDYFCDLTSALQDEIIARTEHQSF